MHHFENFHSMENILKWVVIRSGNTFSIFPKPFLIKENKIYIVLQSVHVYGGKNILQNYLKFLEGKLTMSDS